MNVLYTCDDNYVWLMGISMLSLFDNNQTMDDITVYLIGDRISDVNKSALESLASSYHRRCIVIDLPDLEIPQNLISSRWPQSAFSRLYAGEILPSHLDKVLYLDCDTIVLQPLDELDAIDIREYAACGVKDCISPAYRDNIGLATDDLYVNAGVLLLNLKKMRQLNIPKQIEIFVKRYGSTICYADQDILNGVLRGELGTLPAQYGVMTLEFMYPYEDIMKLRRPVGYYSKTEISAAVKSPIILHFTTCMLHARPWYLNSDHPKKHEFLRYQAMSEWHTKTLTVMHPTLGIKNKTLCAIHKLPYWLRIRILGILHAWMYPQVVKLKAMCCISLRGVVHGICLKVRGKVYESVDRHTGVQCATLSEDMYRQRFDANIS